jgi:hypothetical protein
MDALPFKESDLFSLGGLAIVVPMIVGGLKKLWTSWIDGKEPLIAFIVTYVLGFAAKFTAKAVAFQGLSWLGLVVGLFFVALAATQIHDTVINKIIKGKDDSSGTVAPEEKPPNT